MTKTFRPLKAPSKPIPDDYIPKLKFPLLASPKLDGLRVVHYQHTAVTSSVKPVKNSHTRKCVEHSLLSGMDGEMTIGDGQDPKGFKNAISAVMAEAGVYPIIWWVFDLVDENLQNIAFWKRYELLKDAVAKAHEAGLNYVQLVPHVKINNLEELLAYEKDIIAAGYEGVMLRAMDGRYKYDRSTLNEGILLKLKRGNMKRGDARIIGYNERMQNNNLPFINERGLTERSSHKENMVPLGDLGSWEVEDIDTGVRFSIGIGEGMDDAFRKKHWDSRDDDIGLIVRYEWFDYGGYDKPRHPKYIEFRPADDMTDYQETK